MNTTDALSMWHACSFFCHFQGDLIHPTKCFQEQMGALLHMLCVSSLAQRYGLYIEKSPSASRRTTRLAPLPKPIWGREQSRVAAP